MPERRRAKRISLLGLVVAVLGSFLMFLLWLVYLSGENVTPEAVAPMVGLPLFLGAVIYVSGWVVEGFLRQSAKH
jgi:hypothetical protein